MKSMDLETLLTGTKWDIIKILAASPSCPLDISKKLNTTIANISQQLRLLQAAGLIEKQKTGFGKPGKPRALFSILGDYAFITIFSKGFAEKHLIKLNQKQKDSIKEVIKK